MAIYVCLAEGFEETEALLPADFFVRSGFEVILVSVTDYEKGIENKSKKNIVTKQNNLITGSHNIAVQTHTTLDKLNLENAELIFLPGGLPGADNLSNNKKLITLIKSQLSRNALVGAICAAPVRVLAKHGFLTGKQFTCYPGMEQEVQGATYIKDQQVVCDGNIITSQGVGTAVHFAYIVIKKLKGEEQARKVWDSTLCYHIGLIPKV